MKKILLLIAATVSMAACADSATAPSGVRKAPASPNRDELLCESGYVLAYDENGNPICIPDPNGQHTGSTARPSLPTSPASTPTTKPGN